MLRLLQLLIFGYSHDHRWETIATARCLGDSGQWTRYYCRCSVCGKIKKFD
jgi:hypothetical protein